MVYARFARRLAVLGLLLLVGIVSAQSEAPEFVERPCFPDASADRCGTVAVPLDRENPDAGTVEIAVALRIPRASERTPIVFLAGGPGEHGVFYSSQFGLTFPANPLIFIDHRGVANSTPRLRCEELAASDLADDLAPLDPDVTPADFVRGALNDCFARFAQEGIDTTHFTTSDAAADVADVIRALGYEEVYLYGISYGTRWGQEVIRDHGELIGAAVFDSVLPPEVDRPALTARFAAQAINDILAVCTQRPACDERYPNLQANLAAVIETLNAEPVTIDLGDEATPFDGSAFLGILFTAAYNPVLIAEMPRIITAAAEGDFGPLENSLVLQLLPLQAELLDYGLFFATECRSEVAFSDPATMAETYEMLPTWGALFQNNLSVASPFIYEVCAEIGLDEPAGDDNDPLVSAVPTLFISGQYDPVTPPEWLEQAVDGFSNGYAVTIAGVSHASSSQDPCAFRMMRRFFQNPNEAPDTSCAEEGALRFR